MSPVSSRTIRISRPDTTSGFSDEALASSGYRMAGRRLAKRFKCLRMPSRPRTGRCSRGSVSHCGPPTAPSSTASAALALVRVSAGYGSPVASTAQPPSRPVVISRFRPSLFKASSTRTASAVISGPIPSPGSTRILRDIRVYSRELFAGLFREEPGLLVPTAIVIGMNRVRMAQRQTNIIPTVDQAFLAERIHVKGNRIAGRRPDDLIRQIHDQAVTRCGHRFGKQSINHRCRQDDGQDTVLEAVVEKDVRKGLGDDGTEAVIEQCPRCVFARTAATEILARQQDSSPLEAGLIQRELRIQRPVGAILARLAHIHIAPLA